MTQERGPLMQAADVGDWPSKMQSVMLVFVFCIDSDGRTRGPGFLMTVAARFAPLRHRNDAFRLSCRQSPAFAPGIKPAFAPGIKVDDER
jgi:capsid protein